MKSVTAVVVVLSITLVGCSNPGGKKVHDAAGLARVASNNQHLLPGETEFALSDKAFVDEITQALGDCENTHKEMGLDTDRSTNWNLWIAGTGIVAGSILVPALAAGAAAKSVVAAVGGISGAANAAQLTLNSTGMSPQAAATAQRQFATDVGTLVTSAKDVKRGPEAAAFLLRMRYYCSIGLPMAIPAATGSK